MTTATRVIEALAESLGKTVSSVEAYALALRKVGWWEPTKRGRAASPLNEIRVAKLLLALLSNGPSELRGWWLEYANLSLLPADRDQPFNIAVREILGLRRTAEFLDYLAAFVGLFRDGKTDDLIFHSPDPQGLLDPWVYDGPSVDVAVKGPIPIATISFHLSHSFIDRMVAAGADEEGLMGLKRLVFVSQIIGWGADAAERGEDTTGYDNAYASIREVYSRGIKYERSLGGRELTAAGEALRPAPVKSSRNSAS